MREEHLCRRMFRIEERHPTHRPCVFLQGDLSQSDEVNSASHLQQLQPSFRGRSTSMHRAWSHLSKSVRWRTVKKVTAGLSFGAGISIFTNDNLFETTYIEGSSMAPTLSPNYKTTGSMDLVLWNKWSPASDLQRGDVVRFMNPFKPEGVAAKRVTALEGDTVILDRVRRPSAKEGPERPEARSWDAWKGKAKVPPGHVWVEGDNRRESHDSNYYGPISMSLIDGRAIAVVRPFSKFWTTPWVEFKSRTKVIESKGKREDWTEGLPIELSEIKEPHLPP
jgi:mitochondrial inner membrane protease subunit 2